MHFWGDASLVRIEQLDTDLQLVLHEAIQHCPHDISILCGHRDKEDQEDAFDRGLSNAHFGQSAHNFTPALGFDFCLYPDAEWDNEDKYKEVWEHIQSIAGSLGVELVYGGDWSFKDWGHIELKHWRERTKS